METSRNTEYRAIASADTKLAAERHAMMLRNEVEGVIDAVQECAQNVGDYVTSFFGTLFGGSK